MASVTFQVGTPAGWVPPAFPLHAPGWKHPHPAGGEPRQSQNPTRLICFSSVGDHYPLMLTAKVLKTVVSCILFVLFCFGFFGYFWRELSPLSALLSWPEDKSGGDAPNLTLSYRYIKISLVLARSDTIKRRYFAITISNHLRANQLFSGKTHFSFQVLFCFLHHLFPEHINYVTTILLIMQVSLNYQVMESILRPTSFSDSTTSPHF